MHAKHDREYKWALKVEIGSDNVDENGEDITSIDNIISNLLKSETWINGYCDGSCPNNCTGNQGGGPEFDFVQKSVSPIKEDVRVTGLPLRFMCKGKLSFNIF